MLNALLQSNNKWFAYSAARYAQNRLRLSARS